MISYSSITSPCLHHVSCLKSPKPWHPSTLLSNRRRSARTSCWRCWKPMPPRRTRTTSWCPVCAGPWCRCLKPWIRSMMPGGGEPFLAFFLMFGDSSISYRISWNIMEYIYIYTVHSSIVIRRAYSDLCFDGGYFCWIYDLLPQSMFFWRGNNKAVIVLDINHGYFNMFRHFAKHFQSRKELLAVPRRCFLRQCWNT